MIQQQLTVWIQTTTYQPEWLRDIKRKPKREKQPANVVWMDQQWAILKSYLQIKRINFQMIELAIFLLLIAWSKYLLNFFSLYAKHNSVSHTMPIVIKMIASIFAEEFRIKQITLEAVGNDTWYMYAALRFHLITHR